jgi:hypothetical protein
MTFWEYIKYLLRRIFLPNSLRTMEWQMLKLLNRDRKEHGLKSVRMQEDLRVVARKHSKDMARKDYFEHDNIQGKTPFDRLNDARVTDVVAGENLAKIRGYRNPVVEAEIGLMNSPGHRANILNGDYNTVGVGIIKSVNQTFYYTQNFAARDIIFTKKIPGKATIKKGLRIRCDLFTKVCRIIIQVKRNERDHTPLYEDIINVKSKKIDFNIPFKEVGIYYVYLYINKESDTDNFKIANKFEIKIRKGWW